MRLISFLGTVSATLVLASCGGGEPAQVFSPGADVMVDAKHFLPSDGQYSKQIKRGAYVFGGVLAADANTVSFQPSHFACETGKVNAATGTSLGGGDKICGKDGCDVASFSIAQVPSVFNAKQVQPANESVKFASMTGACNG